MQLLIWPLNTLTKIIFNSIIHHLTQLQKDCEEIISKASKSSGSTSKSGKSSGSTSKSGKSTRSRDDPDRNQTKRALFDAQEDGQMLIEQFLSSDSTAAALQQQPISSQTNANAQEDSQRILEQLDIVHSKLRFHTNFFCPPL